MTQQRIFLAVIILLLLTCIFNVNSFAQSNEEKSRSLYEEAVQLERKQQTAEALSKLQEAIDLDLHNIDAHLQYQRLMNSLDKMTFVDEYHGLCFDNNKDPLLNYLYGNALAMQGKLQQAALYFQKAIKLDAKCFRAHSAMGTYHQMNGDIEPAHDSYEQAIAINPNFAPAYANRSILYMNQAQDSHSEDAPDLWELALIDVKRAVELDPTDLHAYNTLLAIYRGIGDNDSLRTALDQIIELFPNSPIYFYQRAQWFFAQNDIKLGMLDLNVALQNQASYTEARLLRADIYLMLNQTEQALADYNLACQLDSDSARPYTSRGLAYAQFENWDKAITDFSTAINKKPNDAVTYLNRGSTYFKMGIQHIDTAIADFNQAISLNPSYFTAYLNRGASFAIKEHWQTASEDFKKALSIRPHHQKALMQLDACYSKLVEAGVDVKDEHRTLRLKRLAELRKDIAGKNFAEKSLFIKQISEGIAKNFSQAGLDILQELAHNSDWRIRCLVVKNMGYTKQQASVDFICKLLNDNDWHVRGASLMTLTQVLGKQAAPYLINALTDKNDYVRDEALRFLQLLSQVAPYSYDEPEKWQQWWQLHKNDNK